METCSRKETDGKTCEVGGWGEGGHVKTMATSILGLLSNSMTASRFVLGSSIRVLVLRRISLIWLN
jgi:hypothetical protein